ncbi:MAG: peptide deformylase [Oscillospiraceae bacterium]|nr:peptide deformylase [Oscillospiraceae bacterium]
MIKEIVKDPVFLAQKSEPAVKEDKQVIQDLYDTLKANRERCVGMAANMIGVRKTILAAVLNRKIQIMINPEIVSHSVQAYQTEEGCLSLNGTRKTERFQKITVVWLDENFKKKKGVFKDFEAQIIQHEMNHFEGIII